MSNEVKGQVEYPDIRVRKIVGGDMHGQWKVWFRGHTDRSYGKTLYEALENLCDAKCID